MKGFMKGMCLTAACLVIIGIVLSIAGLSLGGQFHNVYFDQSGFHCEDVFSESNAHHGWRLHLFNFGNSHGNFNADDYAPTYSDGTAKALDLGNADINRLSIELGAVEAKITVGDKYELKVDGNIPINSHVSGDSLIFDMPDISAKLINNYSHSVVYITVPRDKIFDALSLNIGAGQLTATGLRAKSASLNAGAGEMIISDFVCEGKADITVGIASLELDGDLQGSTSIDCGMGSCDISLTDSADMGYNANVGLGNVTIMDNQITAVGEAEHNRGAKRFFTIDCGMGNVVIA